MSLPFLLDVATVPANPEVEQQLVDPRRVHRHDDPMDLVNLAQSVMKADQFVRATTHGKLTVIVDQIRALQNMVCGCGLLCGLLVTRRSWENERFKRGDSGNLKC